MTDIANFDDYDLEEGEEWPTDLVDDFDDDDFAYPYEEDDFDDGYEDDELEDEDFYDDDDTYEDDYFD